MVTQSTTFPAQSASLSTELLLPAFTLWWREIVRFYRQRTRVIGVIASPLVFWLVIGSGFGTSFRSGESAGQQHYLDYFYPGALIMIVLFTSIFTMMSVIEDRKEGFLLSVLVARVAVRDCVRKSPGWNYASNHSRPHLPGARTISRNPFKLHAIPAGRADGFLSLIRLDRAWIRHRLANGFHTSLPRHHQPVSDSAMAAVGSIVSFGWSVRLDTRPDAN